MNKKWIDDHIDNAYRALKHVEIVKNGKIDKTYRGQLSTFGAAITMGSLLPAIAFFSTDGESSVDRSKLLKAIARVLNQNNLYDYAQKKINEGNANSCKEEILNAAIALKLAMNLYEFTEEKG